MVEAKDNNYSASHGMQQALGYADILEVPSAFSSNGDAFASHNKVPKEDEEIETEFVMGAFPSPEELWRRYKRFRGITEADESLVLQPYHLDPSGKEPRYYQVEAINRTIEAVANKQKRILLVMATGTGKTYTTFQIIWRLWKAKAVKRVLFLVDRNILADQTRVNDFKPFGSVMTKIKNRKIDPSYEIHLGLYQALTGPDEEDKVYKTVSPDFFDLIVIDECHRGSAAEDSSWREILDYFSGAIHLGLTATPKETQYISNITYFGEPVYTYSLKQGIEDGFLAPYKVVRIDIDKDIEGWTPPPGMKDDLGNEIESRTYNQADMDRVLVLNQRTKLVAERVMKLLRATDPYAKTGMRALVIRSLFEDAYNYMKSGTLMRQVINKICEINFNNTADRHTFGSIYEQILKDLQSAGNAGEFYTPRAVTQFIVNRIDPKLAESVLDPACGTGGFLACTIDHKRNNYVKVTGDEEVLQQSILGVEKKSLPHMLCTTNMILHGIDTPTRIEHKNTLSRPYHQRHFVNCRVR